MVLQRGFWVSCRQYSITRCALVSQLLPLFFRVFLDSLRFFSGFLFIFFQLGTSFPKNFQSTVKVIFKRLFRVYAHIYCHHYPVIRELGLEPHLNTSFKQYVLFIDEHNLASGKDYWGPLGDLVDSMLRSD